MLTISAMMVYGAITVRTHYLFLLHYNSTLLAVMTTFFKLLKIVSPANVCHDMCAWSPAYKMWTQITLLNNLSSPKEEHSFPCAACCNMLNQCFTAGRMLPKGLFLNAFTICSGSLYHDFMSIICFAPRPVWWHSAWKVWQPFWCVTAL